MPHSIFISYASEDVETAAWLCETLERDVAPCWIAPRDVAPGVEYGTSIVLGIKASRVVLLVFSVHADASPHVAREVTIAVSNNITIVPFCLDRTEPSGQLEYALATPHRMWSSMPAVAKPTSLA